MAVPAPITSDAISSILTPDRKESFASGLVKAQMLDTTSGLNNHSFTESANTWSVFVGLMYENLDEGTRRFMLDEIEMDAADGSIYLSNYLNAHGCDTWPHLLRQAAAKGTDDSLAAAIRSDQCLREKAERRKPKGLGTMMVRVPYNAHETLGEGQFNMYYTRGLCRLAIETGISELEVYRAKAVAEPRPESERLIGTRFDPRRILDDLRSTKGVESALGLARPNSGVTLRIPH